jgi:hypothetical protein
VVCRWDYQLARALQWDYQCTQRAHGARRRHPKLTPVSCQIYRSLRQITDSAPSIDRQALIAPQSQLLAAAELG